MNYCSCISHVGPHSSLYFDYTNSGSELYSYVVYTMSPQCKIYQTSCYLQDTEIAHKTINLEHKMHLPTSSSRFLPFSQSSCIVFSSHSEDFQYYISKLSNVWGMFWLGWSRIIIEKKTRKQRERKRKNKCVCVCEKRESVKDGVRRVKKWKNERWKHVKASLQEKKKVQRGRKEKR